MKPTYEFSGHGTILFAAGEKADEFYVHEITTPHGEGDTFETVAFVPHDPNDADLIPRLHRMAAFEEMFSALRDIVSSSEANDHGSLMNAIEAAKAILTKLEGRDNG